MVIQLTVARVSASQQAFCNASDTCQGPANPATATISGDRARPNNSNEYINCSDPTSFGGDPAGSWACVRNNANTAYECQGNTSCGPGFSTCTTPAVCDALNTTSNCTACGNVCGTGAICTGNTVSDDCKCTAGGESCHQTGTNYNSASCAVTNCVLACSAGFADCDGLSTNGCEVDISVPNETHCGGCSTDALGVPIAPPATGSANNCNNVPSTATSANTTCINNLGLHCSYCGDNRYDGNLNSVRTETCDDGNAIDGDGCSSTCVGEAGFSCTQVLGFPSICTGAGGTCGNGVSGGAEECDPAPAGSLPTANCDIDCTLRVCGDGVRNAAAGETCDDGNALNGDGCSSTCAVETGFTCTGPANGPSSCMSNPGCGNGVLNPGEACDAATLPTATCDIDCTNRVCGDGIRNTALPEACDDGNALSGDGCSSTCEIEAGFSCTRPANGLSVCG